MSKRGNTAVLCPHWNFCPRYRVLDQSVSSVDGKAVKILINGVPSTPTDLSVISPENIAKNRLLHTTAHPILQYGIGSGHKCSDQGKTERRFCRHQYPECRDYRLRQQCLSTSNTTGVNSQIGVTYNINYRNYKQKGIR